MKTSFLSVLLLVQQALFSQTLFRDIAFNANEPTANTSVRNIAVYPDQKILICGDFSNYNGVLKQSLIRLLSDGQPDLSFTPPVMNGLVHSIAIQPWDQKVVIGGSFTLANGTAANGVARFNHDGSRDATFNIGSGIGSGYSGELSVRSVVIVDDADPSRRRIYAGGQFQVFNGASIGTRGGLVRLFENGARDAAYDPMVTNGPVYAMRADADGKLVIGGEFWNVGGATQVRVARINADGTRDAGFNTNPFGPYSSVTSVAIDSAGRVLLGGWFTQYNGLDYKHMVRLLPDGKVDTSLHMGSGFQGGLSTYTNGTEARSFAFLKDGTIVVGGNFTSYNGIACNNIICIQPDGSVSDWSIGDGFDNNIMTLQIQEPMPGEERVLAGGFFNSYQSYTQGTVMRLIPMLSVLNQQQQTRANVMPARQSASSVTRVYPNPVRNQLFIETYMPYASKWTAVAYGIGGQVLKQWNLFLQRGGNKVPLDVSMIRQQYFVLSFSNGLQQFRYVISRQ